MKFLKIRLDGRYGLILKGCRLKSACKGFRPTKSTPRSSWAQSTIFFRSEKSPIPQFLPEMEIEPFSAQIQNLGQEKLGIEPGILNPMIFQIIRCSVQSF